MNDNAYAAFDQALRSQVGAPPHADDFLARLWTRIQHEESAPPRAEVTEQGKATNVRRFPGALRSRRLQFVLAGAAVAACVAIAVTWIGVPGIRTGGPQAATAADVLAAMDRASASIHNLIAEYADTDPSGQPTGTLGIVAFGEDGSWMTATNVVRKDGKLDFSESFGTSRAADVHVMRDWSPTGTTPGSRLLGEERVGLSAGYGTLYQVSNVMSRAQLRAILAQSDVRARDVEFDGRPAWRLVLPIRIEPAPGSGSPPPGEGPLPDRWDITIDKQTGYPVRWLALSQGRVVGNSTVTGLSVDSLTGQEAKALFRFPPGTKVSAPETMGNRPVTLAQLAGSSSLSVLLPTSVPEGYAPRSATLSRDRVPSVLYTRGIDSFAVDAWPRSEGEPVADPLGNGTLPRVQETEEKVVLQGGALKGKTAAVVIGLDSPPHLWVDAGTYTITITGGLTRDELVAMADSLAALSP
jgi:hypothetical protein